MKVFLSFSVKIDTWSTIIVRIIVYVLNVKFSTFDCLNKQPHHAFYVKGALIKLGVLFPTFMVSNYLICCLNFRCLNKDIEYSFNVKQIFRGFNIL